MGRSRRLVEHRVGGLLTSTFKFQVDDEELAYSSQTSGHQDCLVHVHCLNKDESLSYGALE